MSKIIQILNNSLVVIFVIIIVLPVLNSSLNLWEFERRDENRAFKSSLNITLKNIESFPAEAEAYLNDNFSFRTPILNIYHYLKFNIWKVSPNTEKTIIGKNNWYFTGGKDQKIYEGSLNFSKADLDKFELEWQVRQSYFDSLGINCYWLICPIKHNIYSEQLPFMVMHPTAGKMVDELKDYLNESFPNLIIDPSDELIKAKKTEKVFYQMDNHWNFKAGYIAANKLLSKIKSDLPNKNIGQIPEPYWKDSTIQKGIHYNVLGINYLSEQEKFPIIDKPLSKSAAKYGFEPIKGFPYKWNYERVFKNHDDTSGLRVLVIRDSFGAQVVPFLKEAFYETVSIFDSWRYDVDKEIIETVKPDIIVYISVESYLDHILIDYDK